ncbi:MAG TPA: alpha/beta hydrolase [Ktedonobacteraceae bacterium]|nr:alpha/beta hydrolase [Ktedonobacteraceae bacterium]
MPLDPQTHTILKRLNAIDFTLTRDMTPEQARNRQRALTRMAAPPEPIAQIENRSIPGPAGDIPLRIYTPGGAGPFPLLVYFHGGGGVIGDLDTEDGHCRHLANLAECLVVSVGYHLAPEYKFPVGPQECYAATQWIAAHAASFNGDPSRLAIGGMSAGGNLAAVITHMARDRGGPAIVFQLLLSPLTDFRLENIPSLDTYAEGYFLTKEDILWFMKHCLTTEEDKVNPLASPALAPDFSRLPPTLIITAEYDPLRDDGERYGEYLKRAGIPVTVSRRAGAIHGFVVPNQLDQALAESATALRAAFGNGRHRDL